MIFYDIFDMIWMVKAGTDKSYLLQRAYKMRVNGSSSMTNNEFNFGHRMNNIIADICQNIWYVNQ